MSVTKSVNATVYRVHADGEWATIMMEHWVRKPVSDIQPYHYVGELVIYSSFGRFGYQWGHCGRPFPQFLLDMDMGYFMTKMYAGEVRVFDFEATVADMKRRIRSQRREHSFDRQDARNLYDAVEAISYTSDSSEFCSALLEDNEFRNSDGEGLGFCCPWDITVRKINPQCEGFWKTIWPEFCNQLREELK